MRAVIFGGSGFLGSYVADELSEKGCEVIIYDLCDSTYRSACQKMIIGDMLNLEIVKKIIEGCDYVFHFAGLSDLGEAADKPIETVRLNILATVNILEACREHKVKRLIYASTFYVHSDKGGFYRCSKQAAEIYIEEYQQRYGLDYTILRYGSLFGSRADSRNGVYQYIYQALQSGKIKCRGTGDELREYIHAEDAARLTVQILDNNYANKHVILTGHNPTRVKDLLSMINDIIEKPVPIVYDNSHSELHYNMTPYSFKPKYSFKLVSDHYKDTGQGLLECIEKIYDELKKI